MDGRNSRADARELPLAAAIAGDIAAGTLVPGVHDATDWVRRLDGPTLDLLARSAERILRCQASLEEQMDVIACLAQLLGIETGSPRVAASVDTVIDYIEGIVALTTLERSRRSGLLTYSRVRLVDSATAPIELSLADRAVEAATLRQQARLN